MQAKYERARLVGTEILKVTESHYLVSAEFYMHGTPVVVVQTANSAKEVSRTFHESLSLGRRQLRNPRERLRVVK